MHIMEGFLPLKHAALWSVLAAPFIALGTRKLSSLVREKPEQRLLLGACAGFVFVLSALKLPSVTGSCSHPTGIGLGAILFGPRVMVVIGFVVLLFQAMLLAHGGLTTLGANLFSMAVAGGIVSYCLYRFLIWARAPLRVSVFFAAAMADLLTYVVTSLQLAWAFPDSSSGFEGSAIKFLSLFALTQLPLAVAEGLLTVLVVNLLQSHATDISVCAASKPRRETS